MLKAAESYFQFRCDRTPYIEDIVGHARSCQTFLTLMVIEGVFERIPDMRLVPVEESRRRDFFLNSAVALHGRG